MEKTVLEAPMRYSLKYVPKTCNLKYTALSII